MHWSLIGQNCCEAYGRFNIRRGKEGNGAFQFEATWSTQVEYLPCRYACERTEEVSHMAPWAVL
jgi:hypothetical protein